MSYNIIHKIVGISFFLTTVLGYSQVKPPKPEEKKDTVRIGREIKVEGDSLSQDSIKKKGRIEGIIDYSSENVYHDLKKRISFLEKNAVVNYTDLKVEANYIEIYWDTNILYAEGKKDSLGKVVEPSVFTQGANSVEYDNFRYDLKTKKGIANSIRTEQNLSGDQGVVVAAKSKVYNDSISGLRKVAFTTDEYFIDKKDSVADYHLETEVAKYVRGKKSKIVTGPIVMKVYDITTPLALPFSFIPMGGGRSTGLLLPSFGERESVGFYIEGAGIYIPIGEYMDLTLTGDIYTKGSYGLHTTSQYKKRYKYSGNLNFDWERSLTGTKGLDDYSDTKLYRLRWTHSQDAKANPNLVFSASVNYSSSRYYTDGITNTNLINGSVLTNTASSSIAINKTFPNTPFTASLNLSHSQTYNTSSDTSPVTFNLPTFLLNMSRIYPFAPKTGTKKGMLQKLGLTYSFNLKNTVTTTSDEAFTSEMFDDMENGAKHKVALNTSTTLLNYFPISFSGNYNEVWGLSTVNKYYDSTTSSVITNDISGFSAYRTYSLSTSLETTLYGIKVFGTADDDKMIKAIRHVITPSLGFSYSPDFSSSNWGYYDSYLDGDGDRVYYSKFEDNVYGSPSSGLTESLSFGLSNNVEMKVRSRKDSTGVQKIKILDYFNISSSYNFAADSLKLSPISITGSTNLLNSKMKINFNATLDPYKVLVDTDNPDGVKIDEFGPLRMTTFGVSMSYSLNDASFGKRKLDYKKRGAIREEVYYFDDDGYAQYLTPWNLSIGLNHTVTQNLLKEKTRTTSLNLSGRISPTPYWDITGSTNIDLQDGEVSYTRLGFSRDLRSFKVTFNMVPFGTYKTWNFYIGIKANILSDALKYEDKNFNSGQEFD